MTAGRRYSLLTGPAFLRTLRRLTPDERATIRRLLGLIQRDPSIDGVEKILLTPEAPFSTYVSPHFYVFYYVADSTIFVVDLERV